MDPDVYVGTGTGAGGGCGNIIREHLRILDRFARYGNQLRLVEKRLGLLMCVDTQREYIRSEIARCVEGLSSLHLSVAPMIDTWTQIRDSLKLLGDMTSTAAIEERMIDDIAIRIRSLSEKVASIAAGDGMNRPIEQKIDTLGSSGYVTQLVKDAITRDIIFDSIIDRVNATILLVDTVCNAIDSQALSSNLNTASVVSTARIDLGVYFQTIEQVGTDAKGCSSATDDDTKIAYLIREFRPARNGDEANGESSDNFMTEQEQAQMSKDVRAFIEAELGNGVLSQTMHSMIDKLSIKSKEIRDLIESPTSSAVAEAQKHISGLADELRIALSCIDLGGAPKGSPGEIDGYASCREAILKTTDVEQAVVSHKLKTMNPLMSYKQLSQLVVYDLELLASFLKSVARSAETICRWTPDSL